MQLNRPWNDHSDEPVKKLTDKQKKTIAEINKKYLVKIVEASVMNNDKLKRACGDLQQIK